MYTAKGTLDREDQLRKYSPLVRRLAHHMIAKLPPSLRQGLPDDGRWLDDDKRAKLQAWLAERPSMATLADFRQRLAQVLDERSHDAQATLAKLHAWCTEAEASGNQALQAFSARLKGYALAPAHA